MRRPRSLMARLLGGALAWVAIAILVAGAGLSYTFRETVERAFQERLDASLHALIAAAEITPDGSLQVRRAIGDPRFTKPYSGWYWQISGREGVVARSRSLWDVRLEGRDGPDGLHTHVAIDPEGRPLQVVERDVELPDRAGRLHFQVAAERGEVESEIARFQVLLAVALGLLGLGLIGAVVAQVRFGLAPLHRLAEELDRVRSTPEARLSGPWPTEVAPLADTMNRVLDHDAALIERARTHVGNLAHALKTPLAVLRSLCRSQRPADRERMAEQVAAIDRLIERHLMKARAASASAGALGRTVAVAPVVASLWAALERAYSDKGLRLETAVADDALFRGERDDLIEILGNLMDNACKWGRRVVRVAAAMDGDGTLTVTVADDGPGMTSAQAAAATARGARLDESQPGSGLGLDIVHDLAMLTGASVSFTRAAEGGLAVSVSWPGLSQSQ